eukprot:Seg441.2 transcript_id=Seg441.2/GoldUCD/mRNA.D3Y31 product="hypothetical protein" protein_id=Seg441.2/GoldUCD/D3Y31
MNKATVKDERERSKGKLECSNAADVLTAQTKRREIRQEVRAFAMSRAARAIEKGSVEAGSSNNEPDMDRECSNKKSTEGKNPAAANSDDGIRDIVKQDAASGDRLASNSDEGRNLQGGCATSARPKAIIKPRSEKRASCNTGIGLNSSEDKVASVEYDRGEMPSVAALPNTGKKLEDETPAVANAQERYPARLACVTSQRAESQEDKNQERVEGDIGDKKDNNDSAMRGEQTATALRNIEAAYIKSYKDGTWDTIDRVEHAKLLLVCQQQRDGIMELQDKVKTGEAKCKVFQNQVSVLAMHIHETSEKYGRLERHLAEVTRKENDVSERFQKYKTTKEIEFDAMAISKNEKIRSLKARVDRLTEQSDRAKAPWKILEAQMQAMRDEMKAITEQKLQAEQNLLDEQNDRKREFRALMTKLQEMLAENSQLAHKAKNMQDERDNGSDKLIGYDKLILKHEMERENMNDIIHKYKKENEDLQTKFEDLVNSTKRRKRNKKKCNTEDTNIRSTNTEAESAPVKSNGRAKLKFWSW